MPRLFHRPPKYCLHKGTQQATVSLYGKRIYLGPYGSRASHQRYQEILKQWQVESDQQRGPSIPGSESKASSVTPATLREKKRGGSPLTINELVLLYRRYTRNGRVHKSGER